MLREPLDFLADLRNEDAERRVVGAALTVQEVTDRVLEEAEPRWFAYPAHQNILQGLRAAMKAGDPIYNSNGQPDLLLFEQHIPKPDRPYVHDLIQSMPLASSWDRALDIVKDLAARRAAIQQMAKAGMELGQLEDLDQSLDDAMSNLLRIRDGQQKGLQLDLGKNVPELIDRVFAIRKGGIPGYRTGFPDLDRYLGGAVRGRNVVIAGRPGGYKTTLATQIAYHIAHQGHRVYLYSTEMRDADYLERIGLGLLGLNSHAIPQWTQLDLQMYEAKLYEVTQLPLIIDDTPGLTPARLRRRIRIVQPRVVIVDYVQRMKADSGATDEYQKVSEISTELDGFKKEFPISMFTVAQLSRASEHNESGEPDMHHLRGSGVLEQDADAVLLGWRNATSPGKLNIKCPKNRFGPAPVKTTFDIKQNCAWLIP